MLTPTQSLSSNLDLPTAPRPRDVQVADLAENTLVFRSRTWDRLKFEVEYSLQKGTTANTYLIQSDKIALFDPPGESFTETFLQELFQNQSFHRINYVILGHVNPNRMVTLTKILEANPYLTLVCSKPAANTLNELLPAGHNVSIETVRDGDELDLGKGHKLKFFFVPTPRWPDAICTYDPHTKILYTDKLFGCHVCGDEVLDKDWKQLDEDRRHYFECLHTAQAQQVETALEELSALSPKIYAPAHGPMVRYSVSRLTLDYRDWSESQRTRDFRVALLFTSAYGRTGMIGSAIARGITQSGAMVESINCEYVDPAEITRAIQECDAFIIGSPTLGGHAPTQIQTALGIILSTANQTKLAGVFGSYGWSGEAVDQLEGKLRDAGFQFGFGTIRVKFTPTPEVLQQCEVAGVEFVQALKKSKKLRAPRQLGMEAQTGRTSQAVGRITNSVCIVTYPGESAPVALLTSWVSQASFSPPGLTVALPKQAGAALSQGDRFVLNVLKEGGSVRRNFQRSSQLSDLTTAATEQGGVFLPDALSYLECCVQNRMDCGDHWLLYAEVEAGHMLDNTGVTAVNHRKSGSSY
jgi:flavorubredoxin/flavin reductase (DIM6/NTAB) family NADH-FMN oxidoreductase RutF